jgi:hypothetical protein
VNMQAPNWFFSVPQAFQGSVKQALFLPNLPVEWLDAISGHEQIQKQLHQFLQQHMLNAPLRTGKALDVPKLRLGILTRGSGSSKLVELERMIFGRISCWAGVGASRCRPYMHRCSVLRLCDRESLCVMQIEDKS